MGLPSDKGFKIRVPHAYTIIFLLMVVFAILTWIVPSGAFERQEVDGREVTIAGTYQEIDRSTLIRKQAKKPISAKACLTYCRRRLKVFKVP